MNFFILGKFHYFVTERNAFSLQNEGWHHTSRDFLISSHHLTTLWRLSKGHELLVQVLDRMLQRQRGGEGKFKEDK